MGLSLLLASIVASGIGANNDVPRPIIEKLNNGVNITRWFGYVDAKDTAAMHTYMKPGDYANFKKLGVNFVRLCINPDVIYRDGKVNPDTMKLVDEGVRQLIDHKLLVFFDLHDNGQMKLDEVGHDNSGFISFWTEVAKAYKGKYEDQLVFEILNEPVFQKNPEVWQALQINTVDAIRGVDPKRTIMAASTSWNGIDTMVAMKPLRARNIIYSAHCYDPFFFTHQGASWVGQYPKDFKNLPFPSSPEAVAAVLGENPGWGKSSLEEYGKSRYDAAYIDGRIKLISDWGKKYDVPVVLGEFGSYPLVAPTESRARWFSAMKGALSKYKVPYAIWGYDDGLGLGRSVTADGSIVLDPITLKSFYK